MRSPATLVGEQNAVAPAMRRSQRPCLATAAMPCLEDIATLTGCQESSNRRTVPSQLDNVIFEDSRPRQSVTIDKDNNPIVAGAVKASDIDRSASSSSVSRSKRLPRPIDKERSRKRLPELLAASLELGRRATETELKEKKSRVDDAIARHPCGS